MYFRRPCTHLASNIKGYDIVLGEKQNGAGTYDDAFPLLGKPSL